MSPTTKFTHLHTHSHYSLLDGLAKIDELVNRAKELGMDSLALTDHGNLYGAIEFYKAAKAAGIKPIIGVEAYIIPEKENATERYFHMILLCQNDAGWKNLIKLITHANMEGFYYKPRINKDYLRKHSEGLIALSACLSGEVGRNILNNQNAEAERVALDYESIFGKGKFFLETGYHPGIKETVKVHKGVVELSKKTGIPVIATHDIHYLKHEDAQYHDILLAVQTGNKLDDPDRLSLKDDDFSMKSPDEMAEMFKDLPEAISNTQVVADQCNLEIVLNKIHLPKFDVPEGETPNSHMRKLVAERLAYRYPTPSKEVTDRVEFEMSVVEKMGFADYFLIVQDFINWAKDRGVVVGPGRGSAAGSILSYILRITDIDPIKYDLLFERFLNPDRIEMPDIDVDITDRRRDEVFGYLTEKYGADRVAHIITFGTMAARAAVRDVGRAMGISYGFCDQLAKLIPFNPTQGMKEGWLEQCLEEVAELKELYEKNADAKRIIDAAKKMEGVARHASVHACGTVISAAPITEYMPLQRAPQDPAVIVTQFEMHSVLDLGLLKMDLLGLKNLTIIEDTVRLVNETCPDKIDITHLPENDPLAFKLFQAADTTGVFQLESSGMKRYLKELKPTELEDIIAMVALYRPGPMELIPSYIARKHGLEKVTYLHPKLEPIMRKTYGVGIYQEQMMRIARDLAGFTLAEADKLRKAIGKKDKELLDKQKEKLVSGMIKNGINPKTAEEIWELFPPFARYGFNRSHAACYATIAYQTAYLKAHYPVEFMASLLNSESGDVDRIAELMSECKKMKINVLPPDINKSSAPFTPDSSNIRFGLSAVKNVGENIVQAIIEERQRGGEFKKLSEMIYRVLHKDLNKKSLESLTKCGAFDSFGLERNAILTNMEEILKFSQGIRKNKESSQAGLFANPFANLSIKFQPATPATSHEKLTWERELLGLYVSDHPLNAHRAKIAAKGARPIKEVKLMNAGIVNVAGLISTAKKIMTKNGKPMMFVKLEGLDDSVEIVVFPDIMTKYAPLWVENKIVLVSGKVSPRDGECKIICDWVQEL
ncbi:MAG: DNA polymerase III subunit alpha [bacterium]|nr:DNA polymerase III subunit alpha [bacterium]